MSKTSRGESLASLKIVDVLPFSGAQANSEQLYISLADLVINRLGYHPAVERASLSTEDEARLSAIIGSMTIEEHAVETLYSIIKEAISPEHKVIRLALNGYDSFRFGQLIGGEVETPEVNPVMGNRGVARYASASYSAAFALECQVIKRLRADGYDIEVIVPFVRAQRDAATIIDRLAEQGLPRGLNGFKLLYSCDVPSSVILAERLIQYFDGVVVDVENLAQFTLGIDQDNPALKHGFDIQNDAVLQLIKQVVKVAHKANKPYLVVCPSLDNMPILNELLLDLKDASVALI